MTGDATLRPATVNLVGGRHAKVETPARRTRLTGVDAARGVALVGMIAVHSLYESDANGRPTWSFSIFGGRAAAAFAVLAGVGIAFMAGARRVRPSAGLATVAALGVRALAIGGIGLGLGYTDPSLAAIILPYYAVMFVLVIPLVFWPTWTVAVVGMAMAVGMPALSHVLLPHLPAPTNDNPTVGNLIHDPVGLLAELSITGEFPALPWMVYLCAGLVIGRLNLTRMRVIIGLLAAGTVLAAAASATSSILLNRYGGLANIWAAQPDSVLTAPETTELLTLGGDGITLTSTWWWLAVDAPHTSTPLDLLGTTGTAIALLGLMLLAGRLTRPVLRGLTTVVQAPLAAAGSMTLTLYAAHVVFINSGYDTFDATPGFLVQVTAALLIGLAWRATAGRGPLEAFVGVLATGVRRLATPATRRLSSQPAPTTASTPAHSAFGSDEMNNESVEPTSGSRAEP